MKMTPDIAERLVYAMLADRRLPHSAFRIGTYLAVEAARSTSPIADPSIAEIAFMLNLSQRYVQKNLGILRREGWITWTRPNRQLPNEYRFEVTKIGEADAR